MDGSPMLDGAHDATTLRAWYGSLSPADGAGAAPDMDGAEVLRTGAYGTVVAATAERVYKGNPTGNALGANGTIGIDGQYHALTAQNEMVGDAVPDLHGCYTADGDIRGYCMDRAPGRPLDSYVDHDTEPPAALDGLAALDLAAAESAVRGYLTELHGQGWAHGDLNPGNIVVAPPGTVTIIDPEYVPDGHQRRGSAQKRDWNAAESLFADLRRATP